MENSKLRMSGGVVGVKISRKGAKAQREAWGWKVRNYARPGFWWGWLCFWMAFVFSFVTGIPTLLGKLSIKVIRANGEVLDLGVASLRVVTTAFVSFVVDQLQTETSVFGDFKYHDSGVGTTAENAADTAMETTDGESRATGTQTESSATAYRSVGTISYSTSKAIAEHGLFNDPTAGTLMDRSVFSAINVVNGDSIQFTYTLTVTAGG